MLPAAALIGQGFGLCVWKAKQPGINRLMNYLGDELMKK